MFSSLIRSFPKSVVVLYAANRLIETHLSPTTLQPLYNGLGDRVGQTVNSTTTDHALDVAAGLPEVIYTSDDDRYLHLPGLIVAENAAGDARYLIPDGLGSVRQAVDSQGEVAVYHEFDPYGSPVENGGDPYGFTGEWWEDDVALLHLRARWYAPQVGIFLSRDQWPGTELRPQSMNGWNYVEGNPVRYIDPSGHLSEEHLQQLLGDDYDYLINLWRECDPYFYDVIMGDELQSGDVLDASLLAGQLYFLEVDGVMRTYALRGATSTNLWDWQGQGAYRITKPGMTLEETQYFRDQLFDRHERGIPNTVIVPVFQYGSGEAEYLGARMINQRIKDIHIRNIRDLKEEIKIRSWTNLIFGDSTVATLSGSLTRTALTTAGKFLGKSLLTGVGVGLLVVDVALTVDATFYQTPRMYSTGWPGAVDINPHIEQSRLR